MFKNLLISLSLLLFINSNLIASTSTGAKNEYLSSLKNRIIELDLANHRQWLKLLHYQKFDTKFESQIDDKSFFISKTGKHNPLDEILQTVNSFFIEKPFLKSKSNVITHSKCIFPARFQWLDETLQFKNKYINDIKCSKFKEWFNDLKPESVSLLFSTYNSESPASMFGHTFLNINKSGASKFSPLNYSISYAAVIDSNDNMFQYAYNGIFGRYKGIFTLSPYYLKIQEYNNYDKRDIWIYDLNISKDETTLLVKHIWELDRITIDYYYFKENCSYHLLSLIEVAKPEIDLLNNFSFVTIPVDTIKILNHKGMILKERFSVSRINKIYNLYNALTQTEKIVVDNALETKGKDNNIFNIKLNEESKIKVLDFLIEYYLLDEKESSKKLWLFYVNYRSQFNDKVNYETTTPFHHSPLNSHNTSRFSFSISRTKLKKFNYKFEYRPSLHDFTDEPNGYLENSKLEMGRVSVIYNSKLNEFKINQFVFVNTLLLSPSTKFENKLSWGGIIDIRKDNYEICDNCNLLRFGGSLGKTIKLNNINYFMLLYTESNLLLNEFKLNQKIGPQLGLTVDFINNIYIISNSYILYDLNNKKYDRILLSNNSISFNYKKNHSTFFSLKYLKSSLKTEVGYNHYF